MSRTASRIRHDEVTRLLKAVTDFGLSIERVTFEAGKLDVVIKSGDIGEDKDTALETVDGYTPPSREFKL